MDGDAAPASAPDRRTGRVFLIGDAAAYVGPITGEGMSWAIRSAEAAVPSVVAFVNGDYKVGQWRRAHARLLDHSRRRCGLVSAVALRPRVLSGVLRIVSGLNAGRVFDRAIAGGAV